MRNFREKLRHPEYLLFFSSRLIKSIRTEMSTAVKLLKSSTEEEEDNPTKLLVLFRDPRAIISSVLNSPEKFSWSSKHSEPNYICSRQKEALDQVKNSSKNVLIVKYEALVTNSHQAITRIAKFLGLPK